MTWAGQVRVVFAKDVRHVWWMLGLLAVVIAMTASRMTVAQPEIGASFGWYDTFIPLFILWIVLAVVRADPPATSTAFWATQPLVTSAVATAKLLQAVIVTGMVLGGVTLILRWWGIAWRDVPTTLMVTATGTMTLALATAVLATVGANVRGVLVGMALIAASLFTLVKWLPVSPSGLSADLARALWALLFAADVLLLLRLYRLREVSVPWQAGGIFLGAGTILVAIAAAQASPFAMTPGVVVPQLSMTVDPMSAAVKPLTVTLEGLVTPAAQIAIRNATLRVDLPDGSSRVLPVVATGNRYAAVNEPSAGRSPNGTPQPRQRTLRASSPLTITEWSRLRMPGARVAFDGTIVEFAREEQQRVPLVSAVLPPAQPGVRQTLQMVVGDTALLAIFTSRWFMDQRARATPMADGMLADHEFLLVDRATGTVGEGLLKESHGGFDALALPGIQISDNRAELRPPQRLLKHASDTSWWAAHEIAITALVVRRVYRVHAETVLGR
jgi:hypothetical protein